MKQPTIRRKLADRKLVLQRDIIRQLTRDDLGRIAGASDEVIRPNSCGHPAYSA